MWNSNNGLVHGPRLCERPTYLSNDAPCGRDAVWNESARRSLANRTHPAELDADSLERRMNEVPRGRALQKARSGHSSAVDLVAG
jgi:hypothetical protein